LILLPEYFSQCVTATLYRDNAADNALKPDFSQSGRQAAKCSPGFGRRRLDGRGLMAKT
jgi:hypothetical protein